MCRTRRDFLIWLSSAVAIAAVPAGLGAVFDSWWRGRSAGDPLEEGLRRLVGGNGPRTVGRAYLRTVPEEGEAATLVRMLLPNHEDRSRFRRASEEKRREALRARVGEDFRAGRMVRVEGWMLARTEARLCALITLA
jgi:hypothetical protein